MPVADASDGVPVTPNRVYVIPPNTELTIANCVLKLALRGPASIHRPIDRFLQSLAEDCGHRSVGVVLSGTGSDGAAGLVAIKNAGGMTFAQDPSSADFPGMPAAAAAAGGTDVVLAPEAIARELARVAQHPHFAASRDAAVESAADADEARHLRAICDVMHEATGIDFSLYRQTTVQRRIQRRLAIRNVESLDEYKRLLAADAEERATLQRDLLIGVTSFFRDPESFDALKRLVFPVITRDRAAESAIRIWVPGCATGEEVYSILISLDEYQRDARTTFPVQVFASDISEIAIEKARRGRYPASFVEDVSPERLGRYFSKVDDSYVIAKQLRERCVFSSHNLLDDPPFSKLDLISCRNVLIYLGGAQEKVSSLFHYALVEGGFLMLGRSETTHTSELFSLVEPGQRIYAKRHVARRPYRSFVRARAVALGGDARRDGGGGPLHGTPGLSRDVDRIVLSRYSPTGVVVDGGLQVLELRGQTAPFLALSSGKASLHLLKLLPDTGLFLEVERLTHEAARTGRPARSHRLSYQSGGHGGELDVEVMPLGSAERPAYLILFETVPTAGAEARGAATQGSPSHDSSPDRDVQIARLTRELQDARARLVALVDEHEASDEENQQIAEDALSANEELQSLSEELETAKEELESTNEELLTVNRELEGRNVALAAAGELAKATVETVGVPLVVVDGELVVRHINAAFTGAFHEMPAEAEGRHIHELCGGALNTGDLRRRLEDLRIDGSPFERCEVEAAFRSIGNRVVMVSGRRLVQLGLMLLTIENVTTQRETERALRSSEERRRQSEKMETIGRLAGGIAHDFNNLLTVIIGNAGLAAETLGDHHEATEHVTEIRRASEKAAALTDQLLSFSRRKVLQPRVFDLNPLIMDFEGMLHRLLGEPIRIVVRLAADACLVRADPAEIGRVVMNLCVNARDAMPAGGVLTIETGHVTLDEAEAAAQEIAAGPYVRLLVGDTGLGMDVDTREHAFEPFFTTKDASKGAGLGLATVFGILKESGGTVACDSELGRGTRFTILLPAAIGMDTPVAPPGTLLSGAPRGSLEVVLLVEDDNAVRGLTKKILERAGYVVLEARDGRDGLSVLQSHTGNIDMLLCDVLMPEMSGGALLQHALLMRPALKVLFVSGHAEDVLVKEGIAKGVGFLQKPYAPVELARKVRAVLDSKQDGAG